MLHFNQQWLNVCLAKILQKTCNLWLILSYNNLHAFTLKEQNLHYSAGSDWRRSSIPPKCYLTLNHVRHMFGEFVVGTAPDAFQ